MSISIIIPTYNEAASISSLLDYLRKNGEGLLHEIIVSDGGSADNTVAIASVAGAHAVFSPEKGRAAQMNHGAALAKGDILYFVHADTIPPQTYARDISAAIADGFDLGRYRSAYQSNSWLLKINAFLSRFDTLEGMGGDQTLFIRKSLFDNSGGFDGRLKIMEEFEFCARVRKDRKYKIFKKPALISARKYETNSWLRIQCANYKIIQMYKSGASQQSMVDAYKAMLDYR